MKEIIIREMKNSDWKEVKNIYQQEIDSGISTFMRNVPEFEYWNKSKLKIGRLVAIYEGKIVGWIVLSSTSAREEYSGVCEISVYIHQDYTPSYSAPSSNSNTSSKPVAKPQEEVPYEDEDDDEFPF